MLRSSSRFRSTYFNMTASSMKLGVFDSGIGGLVIARSLRERFPDLDMMYFGDTLNVPYGARSSEAIYAHSLSAVRFLFEQGCALIIVACNTASAAALRRLQQEYLPHSPYANRRILGVVVPTLEAAIAGQHRRLGLIATNYIVRSGIYEEELRKLNPDIEIFQQNTPLLVPLIENDGQPWMKDVLDSYLKPLLARDIDSLLLGCTHYPYLKGMVRDMVGDNIDVLSQDELIPDCLADYLVRHPEIDNLIGRGGAEEFYLSDITSSFEDAAAQIYGRRLSFSHVDLREGA